MIVSKLRPVCLDIPSPDNYANTFSTDGAEEIINLIQRSKRRYSNMLWNMKSITRHKRSCGHPMHADLIPDVLTCFCLLVQ